jgi:hypothetical protein
LYESKGFRLIQRRAFSSHSKRCISPDAGENQLLGVFFQHCVSDSVESSGKKSLSVRAMKMLPSSAERKIKLAEKKTDEAGD